MSTTLPTPRFRDHAALLLAGTLQTHPNAEVAKLIPVQWGDFFALDIPEIHTAEVTFGVVTRVDAETMDYMVAIEVPNFDGVNAPHTQTIPAAHYAVFTIQGLAHVAQNWQDVYSKWLPTSGRTLAPTPAFERYDARFDPETATGPWELWIPVARISN
jgi:AraC family transcriptional regulator